MEHKSRSRGLAPFASVEDLSDDQDSPVEDKNRLTLPGIREDTGSRSPKPITATPRIDISRASSSSHHDDSSPERDLFAGGTEGSGAKLGLGFTEEMAMELRSSTEELDFQDPAENETKARRKKLQQQHAVNKYELEAQSEKDVKERKDSACSDVGLLSISGRTSRLSSIGSAASGGSATSHVSAVSHISTTSHLSAVSQLSKASRCSSPHRMLLETSFCGPKPIPTVSLEAEYPPKESVEAALLARKTDPTGAVLPSEELKINVNGNNSGSSSKSASSVIATTKQSGNSGASSLVNSVSSKPKSKPSNDRLSKPHSSKSDSGSTNHTKHITKAILENEFQKVIPLHSDEPEIEAVPEVVTRPLSPENGIYIPLKGPDMDYSKKPTTEKVKGFGTDYSMKSTSEKVKTKTEHARQKHNAHQQEDNELVKFISLHGDESDEDSGARGHKDSDKRDRPNRQRSLHFTPWSDVNSLHQDYFKPDELRDAGYVRKHSAGSCRSPDFEAPKAKPATLDLTQIVRPSRPVQSLTQLARDDSRTPSPAASISRGSLFRRSSESSSSSKSRASGSSDKSKKDSKNKSVFSSLFKKEQKKEKGSGKDRSGRRKSESSEKSFTMDPKFTKVEFTFNQEERILDCDSIVIPLHSPDSVVEPLILAGDMQNENEGVVDVHLETSVTATQLSQTGITEKEFVSEVAMLTAEVVAAIEEIKDQPALSRMNDTKNTEKTYNEAVNENQEVQRPVGIITHSKSEISIDTNTETGISSKTEQFTNSKSQLGVDSKADLSLKNSKSDLEVTTESQESIKKSNLEAKAGSEDRRSSESEPDSDAMPIANEGQNYEDDHERKGLVHQPDSLEDELPYVPTTLPQERSVAHPIIPIKQRVSEVKTFPIDRPRSTTPINPSTLDDYVASPHEEISTHPKEKMQIVLPRSESIKENRSKSPARAKPWTHFAEQGLQSPRELRRITSPSPPTAGPPPLPPRSTAAWVSFDELPERRRTPKRITTLPQASSQQPANIVYNYVNPEECSCECHETQTRVNGSQCVDSATGKCASSEYSKDTIHEKDQRVYRT